MSALGRWNRFKDDVRTWVGGKVIKLGAFITAASVHSWNEKSGAHEWRRIVRRVNKS
jgi:hypothetical protein